MESRLSFGAFSKANQMTDKHISGIFGICIKSKIDSIVLDRYMHEATSKINEIQWTIRTYLKTVKMNWRWMLNAVSQCDLEACTCWQTFRRHRQTSPSKVPSFMAHRSVLENCFQWTNYIGTLFLSGVIEFHLVSSNWSRIMSFIPTVNVHLN